MFYIANLLYRFVGACNLANQRHHSAFTKRADPRETFLMPRTATFFFASYLICSLQRIPATCRRRYSSCPSWASCQRQTISRQRGNYSLFAAELPGTGVYPLLQLSLTLYLAEWSHFAQIQVLRHAGDPENQGNYKRRWIVGLTRCTSTDVLMLIAGAKYCPNETLHRMRGEQSRVCGGEMCSTLPLFFPRKPSTLWGWGGHE